MGMVGNNPAKAQAGGARPRVPSRLGDYSISPRILIIGALAAAAGAVSAVVADGLLKLIGLITNLVFYQRIATGLIAPGANSHAWWLIIAAPVAGGLVIGVMARFGSEAIRGHGMPEAIEAILRGGSKIKARVALLKPISAAIAIGTGGPFGAEGPIIMTGGALGSLIAQTLSLTADERKTLLVAGQPRAWRRCSTLLWHRSCWRWSSCCSNFGRGVLCRWLDGRGGRDGVALSAARRGADFPTDHALPALGLLDILLCAAAGIVGRLCCMVRDDVGIPSEDAFRKLPLHWMWWPAIGGLIVGVGGLFEPRALGVGYDVIGDLLSGHATQRLIVGILVVKTLIWSLSLGSGTSGGVLAPVFMIGAALGALLAHVLPPVAPGFWALMCLAAVVGGVMRSPLTGVIFAMELTHQWDAVMPLIMASTVAFLLSVLVLKRSVLTEKVVRKGTHLTREYSTDPLEVFLVGEIMPASFLCFRSDSTLEDALKQAGGGWSGSGDRKLAHSQRLYPVLDARDRLVGLLTQHQMIGAKSRPASQPPVLLADVMVREPIVGHADMTLRELANWMAQNQVSSVPIVDRQNASRVLSVMSVDQVLEARLRDVDEEHKYERVLDIMQIRAIRGTRVLGINEDAG